MLWVDGGVGFAVAGAWLEGELDGGVADAEGEEAAVARAEEEGAVGLLLGDGGADEVERGAEAAGLDEPVGDVEAEAGDEEPDVDRVL